MATAQQIDGHAAHVHLESANATNFTALFHSEASVLIFGPHWEATFTVIAVKRILLTANSTESALVTMVTVFLHIIVEKTAYFTEVTSKFNLTVLTRLLGRLNCMTFITFYFSNRMNIHQMTFLYVFIKRMAGMILFRINFSLMEFHVVMTILATEELETIRTSLLAPSSIVGAAHLCNQLLHALGFFLFQVNCVH